MEQEAPGERIDAAAHRGLLPTYMKQGIPPYLQILFAARAPLPYLPPVRKPPRMAPKGFFEELDYERICAGLAQRREQRLEEERSPAPPGTSQQQRVERWRAKMLAHVAAKEREWRRWTATERQDGRGKSTNPRNTLIVSGLVS